MERPYDVVVTIHCRVLIDPEDAGTPATEEVVLDTVRCVQDALAYAEDNGYSHPILPWGASIDIRKVVGVAAGCPG